MPNFEAFYLKLAHDAVYFAREKQVALFSSSRNHDQIQGTRAGYGNIYNFCSNTLILWFL